MRDQQETGEGGGYGEWGGGIGKQEERREEGRE